MTDDDDIDRLPYAQPAVCGWVWCVRLIETTQDVEGTCAHTTTAVAAASLCVGEYTK